MPSNEDMRKFYPPAALTPVSAPLEIDREEEPIMDEDTEEVEEVEERELEPEPEQPRGEGKAVWVGSPDASRKSEDGISDLFEVSNKGEEDDLRDLTSVDVDADIIDADPDTGDLSDLTDVTEEDVLGDEDTGQFPDATPARQRMMKRAKPVRRATRRNLPTSMGGLNV